MERLTREEFVERFPLVVPAHTVRGVMKDAVVIDRDSAFAGIVEGDLVLRSGAKALGHGIVTGNLTVERGAVLYYDGIVKGTLHVSGAACVSGIFDSLHIDDDASVSIDAEAKINA
ncbi:MAG: hypothetical protein JO322_03675 [Candidatus Eremiobacteraeota bacterium]|nr:hypothetical protein [Candidatus Eremiobacteraeota bacterium]